MANFGANVTSSSPNKTDAYNAAEAISIGDSVYLHGSQWKLAKADQLGTLGKIGVIGDMGVALNTAIADGDLTVLLDGILENCDSLQPGGAYCVSGDTGGDVTLAANLTPGSHYMAVMGAAQSASKCHIHPINAGALAAANNGTAATGVTAVHYGDGVNVTAALTLTNVALTVGSSENLAVGVLIYTLPAGDIDVEYAVMSLDISGVSATADTPDVGLGTTIGAGAVAVLGGTPAFENIITGQTAGDTNGTATFADAAPALNIAAGGDHTVYFNAADGWGANADADGLVNGTVVLKYRYNNA